nr:MAG TPA: hypothetical protein [Caudoviricetes sp.]
MSTNSLIGVKQSDGSIRAITCHYDGYCEHVGKILETYYETEEKANALINLGLISCLGPKIRPESEFDESRREAGEPEYVKHSFRTPQKDVTVAYHRDKGETLEILKYHSQTGFLRACEWICYRYLFMDGRWHLFHNL